MKKKYRDAEIWDQTWYLDLAPENKLIWDFITDNCSTSGLWVLDIPKLQRKTGLRKIDLQNFLSEVNKDYDKISGAEIIKERVSMVCGGRKLWITGHTMFQYSKNEIGVSPKVAAVKGALLNLHEHGLLEIALKKEFVKIANGLEGLLRVIKGLEGLATIEDEEVDEDELSLLKGESVERGIPVVPVPAVPEDEPKHEGIGLEPLEERKSEYGGPDYAEVEYYFVELNNRPKTEAINYWDYYEGQEWFVHNKEGTPARKMKRSRTWQLKAEQWIIKARKEELEKKDGTKGKTTGSSFKRIARGEVTEEQIAEGLGKAFR